MLSCCVAGVTCHPSSEKMPECNPFFELQAPSSPHQQNYGICHQFTSVHILEELQTHPDMHPSQVVCGLPALKLTTANEHYLGVIAVLLPANFLLPLILCTASLMISVTMLTSSSVVHLKNLI